MSAYPIRFESDFVERRSRLTTFFRILLAIPQLLVVGLYGVAALVVVIIAWFALLITGRWPAGMYSFTAGYLRWATRAIGYTLLLTDAYPPFSPDEHPDYPVRLHVAPPQDEYSRLKVLLRMFYVIPAYIAQIVLYYFAELIALASWVVIVITGKQPAGLQKLIAFSLSYYQRTMGLMLLLTETYPPFEDTPALPPGPEVPGGLEVGSPQASGSSSMP